MAALYRAPSILVDKVDRKIGERLTELLRDIGLEVRLESDGLPPPEPAVLHDVALYIPDAADVPRVTEALTAFLGCGPEKALELLVSPPGLIVGEVSAATVEALKRRLPEGAAEITASRAVDASYDLFLTETDDFRLNHILRDLRDQGIEPLANMGLVAEGLDHAQATQLWRRHNASGALRLVNQDFERFDIVLVDHDRPATDAQLTALTDLAGVPEDLAPTILEEMPITLEEGLRRDDLADRLTAYAAAGLKVEARMISFQHVGVEIIDTPAPEKTAETLAHFGLGTEAAALPDLPYRPDALLPELHARLLRVALERTGATVAFTEATQ